MDERIYEIFHLCFGLNGGKIRIFPSAKRFFPNSPDIFRRKDLFVVDDDLCQLDAVVLTYKDIKHLKTANGISLPLNPGGKAILIQSKKDFFHLKRRKKRLFDHKFACVEEYGILPDISKPRWIIPLINSKVASASLDIYQPSLFVTRLIKIFIQFFLRFNGKVYLPFDRLYLFSNKDSFSNRDLLKETLPFTPFSLSMFTGTPGHYRKVTFQVIDRKGGTLGYYKIGETPQSRQLIENEAKALSFLASLNLNAASIPGILVFKSENGRALLGQSPSRKPFWVNNFSITNYHLAFIEEIYRKTFFSNSLPLHRLDCFKNIKGRIDVILPSIETVWKDRLARIMEKMNNYIPKALVFSHGDFTPWNTNIKDGKLYIFDWEFATNNDPPLMDLFHFYSQPAVLIRKDSSAKIVNYVIKKTFFHVNKIPFLANYLNKDSIDLEVRNLFIYYLLKMISLFIPTQEKPVTSSMDQKYVTNLGYIVDVLLKEVQKA